MEKYMIIDGERVSFTDEKNILAVIRKAGIILPTFCYYSDLSIYGACRMCVVEDKWGGIVASCSTPPKHEMEIYTNTPQLYYHRKRILELLLAAHCRDCTTCEKNGKCKLQELAKRFGIPGVRFENTNPIRPIDRSSKAIVKDPNKCILCGDCVRVCNEIQHVGAIDFANRGSKMIISTAFGRDLADTNCVNCGQCAAVCPTGAITIKNDTHDVWEAIHDPKKRVVMQIAPAVRVAIGEAFGYEPGENTIGKLIASLRKLGVDAIFDTSVGADLTIMEESAELVETLSEEGRKYPLFTSCCPGWIRFVETKYPHLMKYVSTSKSPMEMFGAVIKEYYKKLDKEEGKETVSVAIMPCTAKKEEILRPESKTNGRQDIDYVLTTTELISMIKRAGIMFDQVEIESADVPFGIGSGAGVIFGVTGGVTEAVLRKITQGHKRADMEELKSSGVRGDDGIKEIVYDYNGKEIKAAIVSGLANADQLLKKIKSGEIHYDFVEVMACRRGCVMGGGQPLDAGAHTREARMQGLYKADVNTQIKKSDENPMVQSLYEGLLKGKTHELLHRNFAEAEKEKNK